MITSKLIQTLQVSCKVRGKFDAKDHWSSYRSSQDFKTGVTVSKNFKADPNTTRTASWGIHDLKGVYGTKATKV